MGHLPEESPFSDATSRHTFTIGLGYLAPGRDAAGVAPRGGMLLTALYEFDVSGPLRLTARGGYAPYLERDVKDPVFTGALRDAGTWPEPLVFYDVGLALSLTGDKAWRRLLPRVHTSIGLITSLQNSYDVGGYYFGPKFKFDYGIGSRLFVNSRFEVEADLTHALWRMQYPGSYGDDDASALPSLVGNGKLNPWTGNVMLTFSLARTYRR